LGPAGIRSAVETVLARRAGAEVAESVLVHLTSRRASELAYTIYREASGQRAADAVALIKNIAHPAALAWVEAFLADPNVAGWGIALLDQVIWRHHPHSVDADDAELQRLLRLAEAHPQLRIRDHATFIRQYLRERESPAHDA
jgi:3',5'-cyclic AMP phosphodiesterase CpdA